MEIAVNKSFSVSRNRMEPTERWCMHVGQMRGGKIASYTLPQQAEAGWRPLGENEEPTEGSA